MKKRLLTSIVAFILVVSMGTVVALAAPAEDSQSERIGILYYGDDLKIVALQEDIDVFKYAPEGALKEQALQALLTNPNNIVTRVEDSPFVRVGDYSDKEVRGVDVVALSKAPGTWNITPFTISGGSYTYIKPTGKDAFDVAYN